MKKVISTMRYLSFIPFLLVGLVSCDTREDWFAKEGEGATFIIRSCKSAWWDDEEKYEFRNDTIYSDNNRIVEYNVKLNNVWYDEYYWGAQIRYDAGYRSEAINLDIEGLGRKVTKTWRDISVTTDMRNPSIFKNEEDKCFNFSDNGIPVTNIDTIAPVLNTAHIIMELEDVFRNTFYCHVKINFVGDIAPVPILKIKDVDGNPMEKVFDLSKSFDKDGSVEKYEYCIDGEIVEYDRPTFDCNPTEAPAGKGAYGGTYVTSTSQSEIKHAFQKKGEHIVFYRCMDNLGLWSLWYNKTVTIKSA